MEVKHNPIFNTTGICEKYSKKDGVPIKYVCTTDLKTSDVPMDIFFRGSPHPKFGNWYFGIFRDPITQKMMITNADDVEDLDFGCVENDNGEMEYSESHHLWKSFNNGNMIDGGRQYIRSAGMTPQVYGIYMGEFKLWNQLMAEGMVDE